MEKIDVKIVELEKLSFKGFQLSKLTLELSGKTVNEVLSNTLRRLGNDCIPTYAFVKETIIITENTSIFNNDRMRLRIEQMTIPNIENNIIYLEDKYWRTTDYSNLGREKHEDDTKILEMQINVTNETNDIMNVTTNEAKYYEDGEELGQVYDKNYPHLIIQLRPKEVFKCRAVAQLGVGERNNIWAAAATGYHEEIGKQKYKLMIESQGQMDEYDILYRGCLILKQKLDIIKYIIGNKYTSTTIMAEKMIEIRLDKTDHTLGNIINTYLQENKNIAYAGLSKPDLLINEMVIKIISVKPNPLEPFFETIDYVIKLFTEIEKQIYQLGKNFIKLKQKKKK